MIDGDTPEDDRPEDDRPEDDRPENDGPENDGPENDGPENDGPENDGPGNDRRAGRRRNRPRRTFDTSVPSPCIAVCQLDPKTDLCIGCRRHVDEIREWPILTAEQKRAILAALPGRR